MENIIFTQTKETIMTLEKTVTVETERLETIDAFGQRKLVKTVSRKNTDYHNFKTDIGRAA